MSRYALLDTTFNPPRGLRYDGYDRQLVPAAPLVPHGGDNRKHRGETTTFASVTAAREAVDAHRSTMAKRYGADVDGFVAEWREFRRGLHFLRLSY